MGNPLRGEASFEALGQSWTLRYNTNALCEFEDAAGIAISGIAGGGGVRISHLRALVWAGLGHHHKRNRGSLDNIGAMIDEVGTGPLAESAMKALSSTFPKAEGSPPEAA